MNEGRLDIVNTKVNTFEKTGKREKLKTSVFKTVDSLSLFRLKAILRDITPLENLFLGMVHPKEGHKNKYTSGRTAYVNAYARVSSSSHNATKLTTKQKIKSFAEELKGVLGGMINAMPAGREEEILKSKQLHTLLTGKDFHPSEMMAEEEPTVEPAPTPNRELEPEPEPEAEQEEEPIVQVIAELAMQKWAELPWDGSPEEIFTAIKEMFKSVGLDVKAEFFRPGEQDKRDFVVIAENAEEKEKGVLILRPGTILDAEKAFDLFVGSQPGDHIKADSVVSFPRVKREYKDAKFISTYWKVTKHGQLEKYK